MGWFLKRKVWTLEEAMREAKMEEEQEARGKWRGDDFDNVRFEEVGNGESRVLE